MGAPNIRVRHSVNAFLDFAPALELRTAEGFVVLVVQLLEVLEAVNCSGSKLTQIILEIRFNTPK